MDKRMDTIENSAQMLDFIEQNRSLELYAVINGCSFEHFERTLYEIEPDPNFRSLFIKGDFHELRNTVPYLVKLSVQSPFFKYLNSLEGQSWGYFVLSHCDFEVVFEHYKQVFFASSPDVDKVETVFFFFYQPKIAFAYSLNAVKEQLSHFMGPVNYLLIPDYDFFLLNKEHPQYALFKNPQKQPQSNPITKPVITHIQLEAFEKVTQKRFMQKMMSHLSEQSASFQSWTSEQQLRFIEYGIERCQQYDITAHSNIENYLELMLTYGHQFDEFQVNWASGILNDNNLKGSEKIIQLLLCDNAIARMEA